MKICTIVGGLLALFVATAGHADDHEEAELELPRTDAESCIRIQTIRRTEVANDRTILFHMSRDRIYLNRLPHKCPGLRREDRFMYDASLSRLCDLDTVTVLDDIGFGFSRGPTCGLGKFYPISKEDADAFMQRGNATEG